MTTFLFSYRMPKGFVPGKTDSVAAWAAWFEELGNSVNERGNPVFESASLGNCGANTQLGGYSLITAEDLDTALSLAKGCPALAEGAGVEVGVITEVNLSRDGGAS
jgi:YCII-related domain